jgi:hypothetical protein
MHSKLSALGLRDLDTVNVVSSRVVEADASSDMSDAGLNLQSSKTVKVLEALQSRMRIDEAGIDLKYNTFVMRQSGPQGATSIWSSTHRAPCGKPCNELLALMTY